MNPLRSLMPQQNLGQNALLNNIRETVRFAKTFQSPEAFMQELSRQNPGWAQQIYALSRSVKNPLEYAIQQISAYGLSPQQLMSALNGL